MEMNIMLLLKIVFFTAIIAFLIFITTVLIEQSKPELVVTPGFLLFRRNKSCKRAAGKGALEMNLNLIIIGIMILVAIGFGIYFLGVVKGWWPEIFSTIKSKFFTWVPFF